MSTLSPVTARRLPLLCLMLAMLGSGWLPTISPAQEQSGSNLILDADRSRTPGEPRGMMTGGGPAMEDVKRVLQERIRAQSEGQISLFGFRQIGVRVPDLELYGKPTRAVEFEVGIEFQNPGVWASRYRGLPLTFVLLKPLADLSGADQWGPFRIEAKGERFVMQGYALLTPGENGWALAGFGQSSRPVRESTVPDEASVACVGQLKMIGLAFRTWALDNNDRYPFNVSTNDGGTLELCARGKDGFDAYTAAHFQVMSNELSTPRILVCPADSSRRVAWSFSRLQAANVSYLVRSGTNIDETKPEEVLVRCPIHGHVVMCDGSVKKGQVKVSGKATPPLPGEER